MSTLSVSDWCAFPYPPNLNVARPGQACCDSGHSLDQHRDGGHVIKDGKPEYTADPPAHEQGDPDHYQCPQCKAILPAYGDTSKHICGMTTIIALSAVYRQRSWNWYWETWFKPSIRPGWAMTVVTADHEGEKPQEWIEPALDSAKKVKLLDLQINGTRDGHDKWNVYGKTDESPYMHPVDELDWLSLRGQAT